MQYFIDVRLDHVDPDLRDLDACCYPTALYYAGFSRPLELGEQAGFVEGWGTPTTGIAQQLTAAGYYPWEAPFVVPSYARLWKELLPENGFVSTRCGRRYHIMAIVDGELRDHPGTVWMSADMREAWHTQLVDVIWTKDPDWVEYDLDRARRLYNNWKSWESKRGIKNRPRILVGTD